MITNREMKTEAVLDEMTASALENGIERERVAAMLRDYATAVED